MPAITVRGGARGRQARVLRHEARRPAAAEVGRHVLGASVLRETPTSTGHQNVFDLSGVLSDHPSPAAGVGERYGSPPSVLQRARRVGRVAGHARAGGRVGASSTPVPRWSAWHRRRGRRARRATRRAGRRQLHRLDVEVPPGGSADGRGGAAVDAAARVAWPRTRQSAVSSYAAFDRPGRCRPSKLAIRSVDAERRCRCPASIRWRRAAGRPGWLIAGSASEPVVAHGPGEASPAPNASDHGRSSPLRTATVCHRGERRRRVDRLEVHPTASLPATT